MQPTRATRAKEPLATENTGGTEKITLARDRRGNLVQPFQNTYTLDDSTPTPNARQNLTTSSPKGGPGSTLAGVAALTLVNV